MRTVAANVYFSICIYVEVSQFISWPVIKDLA